MPFRGGDQEEEGAPLSQMLSGQTQIDLNRLNTKKTMTHELKTLVIPIDEQAKTTCIKPF